MNKSDRSGRLLTNRGGARLEKGRRDAGAPGFRVREPSRTNQEPFPRTGLSGTLGTLTADVSQPNPVAGASHQRFTQTRWSLIAHAGDASHPDAAQALERLCRTYWPPVYGYLRRQGHAPADAQDLTQEFFGTLLRREAFSQADATRGRFRTFLLSALRHFLIDAHARSQAAKRGGGTAVVTLDTEEAERLYLETPAPDLSPELLYDRRWALSLLDAAVLRLREEHVAAGKLPFFDRLRGFLILQPEAGDYASAALDLGLKPGTVAVAVHRLRQRCRELLREELAETVADPNEAQEEFASLFGTAA